MTFILAEESEVEMLQTEQDEEEKGSTDESSQEDLRIDICKPLSAAHLLATRNEVLRQKKIHIGTLSSGLLENPEEKIMNLKSLLDMLEEETSEIYYTIRKLVVVSLLEVFKDILPSYEIKSMKQEGIKRK